MRAGHSGVAKHGRKDAHPMSWQCNMTTIYVCTIALVLALGQTEYKERSVAKRRQECKTTETLLYTMNGTERYGAQELTEDKEPPTNIRARA